MNFEEVIDELAASSRRQGALIERNRIMRILIQYKKAGWIDESLAFLLADDICVDD